MALPELTRDGAGMSCSSPPTIWAISS
jgi:hypothetical protein